MSEYITEIITETDGTPLGPMDVDGWGDDAQQVNVCGKPMQVMVCRNGKPQFSLRICEDGKLILTDYASIHYKTDVRNNYTLHPSRPWEDGWMHDYFALGESETVKQFRGKFDFPCCCCTYNDKFETEDPCCDCTHNVSSSHSPKDTGAPE